MASKGSALFEDTVAPLPGGRDVVHAVELEIEPCAGRGASSASSSGFRSGSPGPGRVIPRSSPVFLL